MIKKTEPFSTPNAIYFQRCISIKIKISLQETNEERRGWIGLLTNPTETKQTITVISAKCSSSKKLENNLPPSSPPAEYATGRFLRDKSKCCQSGIFGSF